MTNIAIPGKIISIEVEDEAPFGYAEYSDDANYNSSGTEHNPKTVIVPTGSKVSLFQLTHATLDPNGSAGFILSDDFEVGDIVECYGIGSGQFQVYDNNNHGLLSISASPVVRKVGVAKKVFSGTGNDWIVYDN